MIQVELDRLRLGEVSLASDGHCGEISGSFPKSQRPIKYVQLDKELGLLNTSLRSS